MPPPEQSTIGVSRFAFLSLDPTYVPNPYDYRTKFAYFLQESTGRLFMAKVTIDLASPTASKMTVVGDMEPAIPEICLRYASIVYTGIVCRPTYYPPHYPMTEAPVITSSYVEPSSSVSHNHNSV